MRHQRDNDDGYDAAAQEYQFSAAELAATESNVNVNGLRRTPP